MTDAATDEDYDPAFGVSGPVNGWDVNEYGQVIAAFGGLGVGAPTTFVLDGTEIISAEASIGDFLLDLNGNSAFGLNNGQMINDLGQFTFESRGFITDDSDSDLASGVYRLTIRADPIGATVANAVQPTTTTGNETSVAYQLVNGLGLDAPIYVDPIVATEFDYFVTGGPLITSLVIPRQDLGAKDGMFEIFFGDFSRQVGFGETLDFTAFAGFGSGTDAFTIAGIDPGADVAPDSPFVVGLTHSGLGEVSLRITGREVGAVIPLPAALWMLLGGIGLLVLPARVRE